MKQLTALFFSAALAVACLSSAAAGPGSALLVYSTYLGSFADEQGRSVALDRDGRALCHRLHVFCCLPSPIAAAVTLPARRGRLRSPFRSCRPTTDYLYWFNVDPLRRGRKAWRCRRCQGNTYITGYALEDFCTVFGAVPGIPPDLLRRDRCLWLKIGGDGSGLAYCTFLGGSDWDAAEPSPWTSWATLYLVVPGRTTSHDRRRRQSAIASQAMSSWLLDASGTALTYSTYLANW
ncbi:MAG: hypothetical protein H6646_08115 [Anaerolineales bacterium]|nr:hypothetical protein [Anaerolineales bacterium]